MLCHIFLCLTLPEQEGFSYQRFMGHLDLINPN
jgi:hypothetical protein